MSAISVSQTRSLHSYIITLISYSRLLCLVQNCYHHTLLCIGHCANSRPLHSHTLQHLKTVDYTSTSLRPRLRPVTGPPNIGINVGYQKTDFLALVYPCNFRPFWGSNVPFSAPTLQNVVQCTLFGPIPKFLGPLGPNVPKSDLKHSITHFFQSKGQIFAFLQ